MLHPAALLSGASDSKRRLVGEEHEALSPLVKICGSAAASAVKEEAKRQDVALPSWYLMDVKTGMQMARPYNPVTVELEADEELEASYAVSAQVPSCAMWNLLNNQRRDVEAPQPERGRHAIVVDRGLA